jgi:hypothetical protein
MNRIFALLLIIAPFNVFSQKVVTQPYEYDTVNYNADIHRLLIDGNFTYVNNVSADTGLPYIANLLSSYSVRSGSYF